MSLIELLEEALIDGKYKIDDSYVSKMWIKYKTSIELIKTKNKYDVHVKGRIKETIDKNGEEFELAVVKFNGIIRTKEELATIVKILDRWS